MPKLNQLIAIANGRKANAQQVLSQAHHMVQKDELISGMSRTYKPVEDDGERLPAESKRVQYSAVRAIHEAEAVLMELFSTVGAQDSTNLVAKADVVVDGEVLVNKAPVTYLLFLEKQLVDLKTFIEKMPILNPNEEWQYRADQGFYASQPVETIKTKKLQKPLTLYPATVEHPAQVQLVTEDVNVGTWTTTKFSGAMPATDRVDMLNRVRKLQEAVKAAREQANMAEIVSFDEGQNVLRFLFDEYSAS